MITLDQLLLTLSTFLGLPPLSLNEERVCRLILDKKLVIDLEYLEQGNLMHVYCDLGQFPENNPDVARQLLSANLFGQDTGSAVLALDESRNEIMLFRTFVLATLTADAFIAAMDAFVIHAEAWTDQLLEESHGDGNTTGDEPSPVEVGFIRV